MRLVWREAVARIVASQLLAWAVLALPATAEAVLKFAVTPAATGQQLVRSSLPFAKGKLPQGWSLVARSNAGDTPVGVRPLSWYPQSTTKRSVRRAIVSFPHEFTTDQPANFHLEAVENTAKDSVSP